MDSMMMPNHRSYTIEPCRLCCIYNYHKTDILGEPPHMAANDDLCAKIFRCVAIHVSILNMYFALLKEKEDIN